jgi:protein-tyrosine phosphatase
LDSFEIVFVCTGNRFRSPIAAGVFEREAGAVPLHAHSAGTLDLPGAPALPEAVRLAAAIGLDLEEHRSRCVLDVPADEADLVIGFERQHVAHAVVEGGAARERVFLLSEVVSALEEVDRAPRDGEGAVERARRLVTEAARHRPAAAQEIPDPIGGGAPAFENSAAQVRELTAKLAHLLFNGEADGR